MTIDKLLKSKTIWFALALAVFGVIETQMSLFAGVLPSWAFGLFSIAVSVAVAVLRIVTTVPLSEK